MTQEQESNLINALEAIIPTPKPYLSWIGLVTQSGTDDPTAGDDALLNELNNTFFIDYVDVGKYRFKAGAAFDNTFPVTSPQDQTMCKNSATGQEYGLYLTKDSDADGSVIIETILAGSDIHTDDALLNRYIEIQVWTEEE